MHNKASVLPDGSFCPVVSQMWSMSVYFSSFYMHKITMLETYSSLSEICISAHLSPEMWLFALIYVSDKTNTRISTTFLALALLLMLSVSIYLIDLSSNQRLCLGFIKRHTHIHYF